MIRCCFFILSFIESCVSGLITMIECVDYNNIGNQFNDYSLIYIRSDEEERSFLSHFNLTEALELIWLMNRAIVK